MKPQSPAPPTRCVSCGCGARFNRSHVCWRKGVHVAADPVGLCRQDPNLPAATRHLTPDLSALRTVSCEGGMGRLTPVHALHHPLAT